MSDGRRAFYCGYTNNMVRREKEHHVRGFVSKQSGVGPMRRIEMFSTRAVAMAYERVVKALPHAEKRRLYERAGREMSTRQQ
jgi:predicted GIY-YIG superfamily endonuclease